MLRSSQLPTIFLRILGKRSQDLSRFKSDNDIVYETVIDQIKSGLVFKFSIYEAFHKRLEYLVDINFPLESRDRRKRTPLHWAASTPNLRAAEILMGKDSDPDLTTLVDANGQTPLHGAMEMAAKVKSSNQTRRKNFKDMIRQLISNSLMIDAKDKKNMKAWDYAQGDDEGWVKELKDLIDRRELILGSSRSTKVELDKLEAPALKSQLHASQRVDAILVEFFLENTEGRTSDRMNPKERSIFELIYDSSLGLEEILCRSRPKTGDMSCRWIHLPANNASIIHRRARRLR